MSSLITSLGGNDEIGVWKLCWTRNLGITWNYFFFMKKIDCRRMIFIYDLVNLKDWFIQSYLHKSSFIWSDLNFWPQGFEDVTNFAIFSLHCRKSLLYLKAVLCLVWLLATPWSVAHQAPLFMGILQARILEWVAIPFSRESSQPRDRTQLSCIAGRFFTSWATREAPSWKLLLLSRFIRELVALKC